MSAPFIPELSLGTVETGGGWGVGEQFARLPPASVQAESRLPVYTVGPDRSGSKQNNSFDDDDVDDDNYNSNTTFSARGYVVDDVEENAETVPTTHYVSVAAEDDNTFVDHGSAKPSTPPHNGVHAGYNNDNVNSGSGSGGGCGVVVGPGVGPSVSGLLKQGQNKQPTLHLKFSRCVSRMMVKQGVRAMAVAPDGGSLWAAFGDEPIALLDFKGVELNVNRTVDVVQVHALGVVRVPAAKTVTFKPTSRAGHRVASGNARRSQTSETDGCGTHALWCGVSRGSIVIVDLTDFRVAGVIKNAHTQTITGLWQLGNGKVWTAGYDKALRLWDPQTRCRIKCRNIASVISGLCYVSSCRQVWTISDDQYIRVFDATGNNLRVPKQSPDKPDNALRMRSEIRFIEYYEPANLVYVSLTRGLAAVDPATCEIPVIINLNITSMSFLSNTALVTGHGELLQCTKDSIGLIDLSDPYCPVLLFRGAALGGNITPVGMRLLTAVPFAVAAQESGRADRFLTVFNYEDSKAFCRGGSLAFVPQQRKITVESPSTRRNVSVTQQNLATSPSQSTTAYVQTQNPVVFATGKRSSTTFFEEGGLNNSNPPRATVVVPRVDNNGKSSTTSRGGVYNNSNNNSTDNNNRFYRSVSSVNGNTGKDIAVQLITPPELMLSLTNIEKKTEDLKAFFIHMQVSRPLLDDLAKLHANVSQLAMTKQLGPNIDSESMDKIEKTYQTHEGRFIAAAVERLRKGFAVLEPHSTNSAGNLKETTVKNAGNDGGGNSAGASQITTTGRRSASIKDVISTYKTDDTSNVCGSDVPPESLLRWVAQITRSGQSERESHRRQLESLQRHNTRIVERNAALINGVARMEQALRTHAQRMLEDADFSMTISSHMGLDTSAYTHLQRHVRLLNQSLNQIEQVSVSSSPSEITRAFNSLITLNARLFSLQQFVHGDEAAKRAPVDSMSAGPTDNELGSDVLQAGASNGTVLATCSSPSPKLVLSNVVAMRPDRMRNVIENQILSVEAFVKDIGKFWCCLEETKKVIYMPYEGGEKPDFSRDFMQLAVLWHLREAQIMIDVCKSESIMVMAEALLSDIESKEGAEENNTLNSSAAVTSVTMNPARKSVIGDDMSCVNSMMSVAGDNANITVKSDLARLVSIGIELESVASRIRESVMQEDRNLTKNISREVVGGFFLISREKLHVEATRLRGMLYWQRVAMHLLFECLESLEDLVFHGDERPRVFCKDNFKAMEQQIDDWRLFLENLHGDSTRLRFVIMTSQLPTATGATNAGPRSSADSGDAGVDAAAAAGRSSHWATLFALYVQHVERSEATPLLFASHDSGDAVSAADFGLMAVFDEIADLVETVRAKSAALLHYCQKVQGRLGRVVEDAVVNEERGQVLIPAFRGGPVAERYCKGFCHDMT